MAMRMTSSCHWLSGQEEIEQDQTRDQQSDDVVSHVLTDGGVAGVKRVSETNKSKGFWQRG
jgi:hypothetical protein